MRQPFRTVHRTYLWVSTVQWVACLLLVWWTLRAWAAEDGRPGSTEERAAARSQ
jgi:hypothetical protein